MPKSLLINIEQLPFPLTSLVLHIFYKFSLFRHMMQSATKHPQVTRGTLYSNLVSASNCGFGRILFENPWGSAKCDSGLSSF